MHPFRENHAWPSRPGVRPVFLAPGTIAQAAQFASRAIAYCNSFGARLALLWIATAPRPFLLSLPIARSLRLRAAMVRPEPPRPSPPAPAVATVTPLSSTATVGLIAMAVGALYLGSEILIPLALAILLSFTLAPIVIRLRRWGLGRIPSVLAVVLLLFIALLGVGSVVATQLADLATNLPTYEWNLRSKIRELRVAIPSGGVIERTQEMFGDLRRELQEEAKPPGEEEGEAAASGEGEQAKPVLVQVQRPPPTTLETLRDVGVPLIAPFATAGLVVVLVIFMLLQREDLRDRVLRLVGGREVARATEAMDDAAKRISRYLLMQLLINVLYGIPVAVGLYFIGVPNPILWGCLATVLRFIPYLGPVMGALLPISLSFAVSPGWTLPLLTVTLFVVLELFSNNVLEPWLYGSSTGLSPVAVLVAAVFWTMLWGPIGLLMSTPLTVCLVVLGRHVPQLGFFDVLLGDEPAFSPEVKFYQRLLARDPEEATELAEEYLEDGTLDELYDSVILPALVHAEHDRLRGSLPRAAVEEIAVDTIGVIDELEEEQNLLADGAAGATASPTEASILCIGARNGLDEAAAALLAHLLARSGVGARTVPRAAIAGRNLASLERQDVALICLSYVNPEATQHAQRTLRRLRQHFGAEVRIMVGMWTTDPTAGATQERLRASGADVVVGSLRQAVRQIEEDTSARPEATSGTRTTAA
jgi:predicted PurR-regulated permease PerM